MITPRETMTTEEFVTELLTTGQRLTRPNQAARLIRELKDAHAHQLAEQIREDAQQRHARSHSDNRVFELKESKRSADLIDPGVQR